MEDTNATRFGASKAAGDSAELKLRGYWYGIGTLRQIRFKASAGDAQSGAAAPRAASGG
jgi:hypothetical protein